MFKLCFYRWQSYQCANLAGGFLQHLTASTVANSSVVYFLYPILVLSNVIHYNSPEKNDQYILSLWSSSNVEWWMLLLNCIADRHILLKHILIKCSPITALLNIASKSTTELVLVLELVKVEYQRAFRQLTDWLQQSEDRKSVLNEKTIHGHYFLLYNVMTENVLR